MPEAARSGPPLLPAPPFPQSVAAEGSRRSRELERRLLLLVPLLLLPASWGLAAAQPEPLAAFRQALFALGTLWLACLALHAVLCLTGFRGDPFLLPLTGTLLLVAATYHLGLAGPAPGGLRPTPYLTAALIGLGVIALVTCAGRQFRRLSLLLEERLWWRVAGDRPYYESIPFHALLVATMAFLSLLLLWRGIRGESGAVITVALPGGIRFTPSELIRLAVAFFLADYLSRNSRLLRLRQPLGQVWPFDRLLVERTSELAVLLLMVGLYCLFFYAFRDFGPAVVIVVLTLATLYAATGRLLTPLLLSAAFGLLVAIPTWKHLAFHTLRNRVEMWLDPWHTSFVYGDHLARILWSIASGGWFGLGAGAYDLRRTLPLAANDAAFAGLAASMGMWAGLAVLGLFAAITWRGMLAACNAPTDRTRLLAFSLTALLAVQAIWISGAMVRVFPLSGINLPFVSTGLTSMIACSLALGVVWSISGLHADHSLDPTEATPEVLAGVRRLAVPVTAGFLLPAAGLLLYGCPWLLGDRTLVRPAEAVGRVGERAVFANPYLERFRNRFPRGRIFSADDKLLAVTDPGPEELAAIRRDAPALAAEADAARRRGERGVRYYPLGSAAAHLVGWTPQGRFMASRASVETVWDPVLRGYAPEQLPGLFRRRHNPFLRPPEPQDLQLTVSAELQRYALERLRRAIREWDGAGGALVLYDVATGEVLAAVSAPTFDPNGLSREKMQALLEQHRRTRLLTNKALDRDALFFPGSAFKILTAGAALEAGIAGAVTCRNGRNAEPVAWSYRGRRWQRPPGAIGDFGRYGHGRLGLTADLEHAFTVSCNVFFSHLAARLGPEAFHAAMTRAELRHVPSVSELAEHLPYAGFGQIDVKTGPLEMARLAGAAAAALEGLPEPYAARPHWVKAIVSRKGAREPEGLLGAPDRTPYRPLAPAALAALRSMMVRAVADPAGTAHAAFFRDSAPALPGITVGGKTGTAEFERPGARRGRRTGRHAWFVGFARSDHEIQPRTLAFAVLVEDVRRGGTGGTVCAPVARDVLARALPTADRPLPPDSGPGLEEFYRRQIRPRLGPLGPILDWLERRIGVR